MTKNFKFDSIRLSALVGVAVLMSSSAAMSQPDMPPSPNPIPMMAPVPQAVPPAQDPAEVPAEMPAAAPTAAPTPAAQPQAAAPAPAAVPSLAEALEEKVKEMAPEDPAIAETADNVENKDAGKGDKEDLATTPPMPGMDLPIDGAALGGGNDNAQMTQEEADKAAFDSMRQEAFEAMMTGLLPLNPPQIREALTRMDANQKAIAEPLAYPKPELAFTTISLDPGSTPLTFKLATGHVTTVTFLDITGEPWPIKDVSWAGNFEIKAPTTDKKEDKFYLPPNVLRIIPMSEFAYGNVSMRLVGLPTPVTFTLRTGRETVQYRLDIRIPEMGPFAQPPLIENGVTGLTAGDAMLTQIMEGLVPPSAEKLTVTGVDGRTTLYRMGGMTYVRTPLTLLSPGWSSSVRSADGMNVYAIGNAPVLLLSDEGRMVRAQVTDTVGEEDE